MKERRSKKPAPVIVTGPLSEHVNEENQRANGYPRLTWKVVDQVIFHRLSWIFELVVVGTVYQGVQGEAKLGQLISHYKSKRCFTRQLAVTCSRCTWMDLQDIALFQIFWKKCNFSASGQICLRLCFMAFILFLILLSDSAGGQSIDSL